MLACIVLAFSLGMVSANGPAFEYPEDPANGWTGLCEDGMMQSPIDLDSHMVASVHSPITYKGYFNGHFNKHHAGLLVNSENTVSWYASAAKDKMMGGKNWRLKCPSVRHGPFGGMGGWSKFESHSHAYYFWKADFHWGTVGMDNIGSEHTIDGMQFPLEMQMVHIEDKFVGPDGTIDHMAASADPHGIAILSILFKVNNKKAQNQEPLSKVDDQVWEFHHHPETGHKAHKGLHGRSADDIEEEELEHYHGLNMRSLSAGMTELAAAKEKRGAKAEPGETKLKLNIGAFLRKATRNGVSKSMSTYWTYRGSTTSPGCHEAVTWVVFQRSLPIAQVQANAFASLFPNNFRMTKDKMMGGPDNCTEYHNVQYLIHRPIGH